MSGTGNDFIFIDESKNPGLIFNGEIRPKLCNRKNGIGADGVITIQNSDEYDFIMNYYRVKAGKSYGKSAECN